MKLYYDSFSLSDVLHNHFSIKTVYFKIEIPKKNNILLHVRQME